MVGAMQWCCDAVVLRCSDGALRMLVRYSCGGAMKWWFSSSVRGSAVAVRCSGGEIQWCCNEVVVQ